MSNTHDSAKHSHALRKTVSNRRGTSAVEFALIAPLMILFTFGLIEIGRVMLVKQTATHASREAARVAVRPTADYQDVIDRATEELSVLGIQDASTIELVPSSLQDAAPGTPVTVRVLVDAASVSWVSGYFDFTFSEIIAESSMRRESTD
ncbi:MAG: TadE/TadG family type IV pilus assembly protein [Rubripirellula sp.]